MVLALIGLRFTFERILKKAIIYPLGELLPGEPADGQATISSSLVVEFVLSRCAKKKKKKIN